MSCRDNNVPVVSTSDKTVVTAIARTPCSVPPLKDCFFTRQLAPGHDFFETTPLEHTQRFKEEKEVVLGELQVEGEPSFTTDLQPKPCKMKLTRPVRL
jgi:hypothetical protein